MGKHRDLSRRQVIVASAVAGGGLALGIGTPGFVAPAAAQAASRGHELSVWVAVKPDETCIIRIARSEMGQGTITGLAQLVAEELQCDWKNVRVEFPTPGENHARKRAWGEMSTGGSRGIRVSQLYVRQGGAAARTMLLQAAANEWGVPVSELRVDKGVVTHAASRSSRHTTYGKLAEAAAKLPVPEFNSLKLKNPNDWTIAGQPLNRIDTADKLNGAKTFAIDVKLPGMLNAAVKDCPVYGGKLKSYDAAAISAMPGVKHVLRVSDSAVAVVADTWWRAKAALEKLPIVWDEGANAFVSSASIADHLRTGLVAPEAHAGHRNGDALAAIAGAAKKVEATYATPFLAHATMEPMNCTAKVTPERAEIWVATQNGEASHAALAAAAGLPLEKCEVYKLDLGGGFGRRGGTQDYVTKAVAVARQLPGVPVKMIWSREEDQTHDFFRPISMAKLSAGLDEKGDLVGLHIRVSGQSINAYLNPAAARGGLDDRQLQGLLPPAGDAQFGYTLPNMLIEYAMRNTHVPVGPWRGVNTNQNGVYAEVFIDEVAKAAGRDPLEFRRAIMKERPKHLAVLEAACDEADYGKPLPAGVFRGIAQFKGYGSYSAAVAEVSIKPDGKVKVHRLVLALDSGHVVNPSQVAAQVEGSVAYGLSATFYGEMNIEKGRMVELNFDTYEIMRLAEFPKVETVLVPSGDFWGGVGEPTICVVAPAVMNAIAAATGKPVRSLPLRNLKLA